MKMSRSRAVAKSLNCWSVMDTFSRFLGPVILRGSLNIFYCSKYPL